MRNLPMFLGIYIIWLIHLVLPRARAAFLTIQYPNGEPPAPENGVSYVYNLVPPVGHPASQITLVADNYTVPLIVPNALPTTWYNVTVFVGDLPLPTRRFLSGPDAPTSLEALQVSSTETIVSWKRPVRGDVDRYRIQLLTRDASGNVSKGVPLEWESPSLRVSPLVPGSEYAVEVVSLYKSTASEAIRLGFVQPPASPNAFRKTVVNETGFTVQWDPSIGVVDGYFVSLASSAQPNDIKVAPTDPLKATFLNLSPATSYVVSAVAFRANFSSAPVYLNVTTRPPPPTDLRDMSVEREPRLIQVSWKSPGTSKGVLKYQVSVNGSDVSPINTTDTQAALDGLLPDGTYSVGVQSFLVGPDGNAVFSKTLKGTFHTGSDPTVTVTAVLGAPELLMETADHSVKFLEANATSEDNLAVTGDVSTGQRVYFRDLVGGTHYQIYVKLLQNGLTVIRSFEKLTYPIPPIDIFANTSLITTQSVALEWSKPLNTRFQGYQIFYSRLDEAGLQPVNVSLAVVPDASLTSFNVTGLTSGAKYAFRMKSLIEDVASVETPPVLQCTRPLKPTSVTVRPMSVKLMVQLTRPSNTTKYYRLRLLNLDMKDMPARTMDIRNDSAVVAVPVPIDFLGATYEVRVAALVCSDLTSEVVTTVVNSLPPVVNFNRPPAEVTQTSIKVVYQSTWPIARSIFSRYVFQINGMPPKYFLPGEIKTQTVEFTELIPGTKYTIFAWTERGDVQSDRKSIEIQMKPDNVTVLNATKISSRSIAFAWDPPPGAVTQYEVGYNNSEPVMTNETSWIFNGLLPYKIYSVYVAAWSGTERSSAMTKFYTTQEDKPGRVSMLNLSALRPNRLLVRWGMPESPNGVIIEFRLEYKENTKDESWERRKFPAANLSYILDLSPGKTYLLRVAAVNSAGVGPVQDGSMVMPLGAPILARAAARPLKSEVSKDTITLEFNKDYFLDNNGEILKYAVIVAEDPLQNLSYPVPSWNNVHGLPVWPPYVAIANFNPFEDQNASYTNLISSDTARVVIGADKNCLSSTGKYCNGPLKESTRYYVKLRAFTSIAEENLLYADTIYTDAISTEGRYSDAVAIALGICVPLAFVAFLAAAVVFMRKYNWGPFVKRARKAGAKQVEDKISIAESLPEKSRPVSLKDFPEHVRIMSADSDFKFSEEYEDLKDVGRNQLCLAADFPVNRAKNRFTNILPYDHSRVKLLQTDDEEGSDYINANYIPGFNSPREFIVTQGPLPSTRDDFWRMIWEQNCRAVVMLTRCVEKGREKCDHYWPYDTDSVTYGDVNVVVMNETQTLDWTLREFRVAKEDEPARSVRHFHFTAWPDFGVPERPQTLVKFVRAFRDRISIDVKPILVHCSAGVGRSGTFIALDRLLQQIKIRDTVDIFGMVVEMRKERVLMVQTEAQYICIHQCLLCVLENREDEPGSVSSGMHENPCYEVSDDEGIVESGPF